MTLTSLPSKVLPLKLVEEWDGERKWHTADPFWTIWWGDGRWWGEKKDSKDRRIFLTRVFGRRRDLLSYLQGGAAPNKVRPLSKIQHQRGSYRTWCDRFYIYWDGNMWAIKSIDCSPLAKGDFISRDHGDILFAMWQMANGLDRPFQTRKEAVSCLERALDRDPFETFA